MKNYTYPLSHMSYFHLVAEELLLLSSIDSNTTLFVDFQHHFFIAFILWEMMCDIGLHTHLIIGI